MGSNVASAIVKRSNSSFRYSFSFLPHRQRDAIRVVYAFCRETDDIVDTAGDVHTKIDKLRRWRLELEKALGGASEYQVLNQLSAIAKAFHIPVSHFYDLIRGVEIDLTKQRYESFEELREYCLLVASSVGLMCMGIFGSTNRSRQYAIDLGIALQLTNIVRDVGIDASYGRIYLPREDLVRFGCREEDILARKFTPSFRELMRFEVARAEEFYQNARLSLASEDRKAMFPAKIMERIYYHTLLRVKQVDYNVFDHPIHLPRGIQVLIAVKYWVVQRLLSK